MSRKLVKIDQQALKELVGGLVKFRDCLSNGYEIPNMAISGLAQIASFYYDVVFDVTVPVEDNNMEELATLKRTYDDGLISEEEFWNQVASLAMAKLGIVEVPEHFTELDLDDCLDHSELHAHQQRLSLIQKRNDVELLCKCGINPATEPHPCPYQSDVNNDSDTLCTCCEDCQKQCADDI